MMTTIENELREKIREMTIPNQKLVFVHIPKNAGTTVMRWIFDRNKGIAGHLTADMVNSVKGYENYKNFAFCRNPFDRFISVYLWRLRKDELIQSIPIEEVIERLTNSEIRQPSPSGWELNKNKLDRMFLRQVDWVNKNTIYLGRTESTAQHMIQLSETFGLGLMMSKTQTKSHHNKAKSYGPQPKPTKNLVIDILNDSAELRKSFFNYYGKDFEHFGYNPPKRLKD